MSSHGAAVIGVGHSAINRFAERPLGVLAVEAVRAAAADAGLAVSRINGVASVPEAPFAVEGGVQDGIHFVSAELITRALDLEPTWGINNHVMVGNAFIDAVRAVEAGACDCAVVVRGLHNPRGTYGLITELEASGPAQFIDPYGLFYPAMWAQMWHRYQDKYASGAREQMASFVVQSREYGLMNPNGYWTQFKPQQLTRAEYLDARMVTTPLGLYDCDIPMQGAAAFIVTSPALARASQNPAAYIYGVADPQVPLRVGLGVPLDDEEASGRRLAELLWKDSGLTPGHISVANVYDGFSIIAMLWLEALGFCGAGEAFDFVQDGRIALDGELPLNTGGGNLGAGRMHGVPHLMDSVLQVMGRAGEAQVANVEFSLAAVGPQTHGAVIAFGREPQSRQA